ncbi:MAG: hypothetical protein JWM80_3834, partial [Cyanobacteria bacterium RYN_339]|nr:hypothetical protein [Cyanobacteria bacterium RYN_339]
MKPISALAASVLLTGAMLLAAACPATAAIPQATLGGGVIDRGENDGVQQFGWPTDSPAALPARSSAKPIDAPGGVDFLAVAGSPVYAAANGEVLSTGPAGIVVTHGNRLTSIYTLIGQLKV